MKRKVMMIFLSLFVVACGNDTEEMLLKHQISDVIHEDIRDVLAQSSIANEDKEFIIKEIDFEEPTYDFISINVYETGNTKILVIDTFNYEDSIHSVTGERSKVKHGTLTRCKKSSGEWSTGYDLFGDNSNVECESFHYQ